MGTDYDIMFLDEFDWGYVNYSKEQFIREVKLINQNAEVVCDIHGMIIFSGAKCDRLYPEDFVGRVKYDRMLYRSDISPLHWQEIKEKLNNEDW